MKGEEDMNEVEGVEMEGNCWTEDLRIDEV